VIEKRCESRNFKTFRIILLGIKNKYYFCHPFKRGGLFQETSFENIFSESVARIKKSNTFALPFKEKEI